MFGRPTLGRFTAAAGILHGAHLLGLFLERKHDRLDQRRHVCDLFS